MEAEHCKREGCDEVFETLNYRIQRQVTGTVTAHKPVIKPLLHLHSNIDLNICEANLSPPARYVGRDAPVETGCAHGNFQSNERLGALEFKSFAA
jgi:hypothetical protein